MWHKSSIQTSKLYFFEDRKSCEVYSTAWNYGPIGLRQNLVFAACSHLASTAGENM